MSDYEFFYYVEDGAIKVSINGQIHAPITLEAAAKALNDYDTLKAKYDALREAAVKAHSAASNKDGYLAEVELRHALAESEVK